MARPFKLLELIISGATVVFAMLISTRYMAMAVEPRDECSLPLHEPRWIVPTVNDFHDEQLVMAARNDHLEKGLPALPRLRPLTVGQYVLTRTMSGLIAVEFKTGKRIWEYPWDDDVRGRVPQRDPLPPQSDMTRTWELDQRLHFDGSYHQLSSDGQSVFLLDDLGYAFPNVVPQTPIAAADRLRSAYPGLPKSYNTLVALDLQNEGGMRWMVGGSDGRDEPKLAGAFFLGAPLPVEGQLYVLAEMQAQIHLVVLDTKTGKQSWSLELFDLGKQNILYGMNRRLAGATLAYINGVVVCPTAAGVIIGVDAKERSQLWRYAYTPTNEIQLQSDRFFRSISLPLAGWQDTAALAAAGRVLVTTIDSDDLHCIDPQNGNSLWLWPRLRGEMLFVAGIHGEHAVLVGKHEVTAVKLSDSSAAWAEPVMFEALPSGRGFLYGRHYFLPTTASELLKIDVAEGRIVERASTDRVLGNLFAHQDQIISHGVDVLATYYQREPLRPSVERSLKKNPDDAAALELHAKLLLADGRQSDALAVLRRAHDLQPQSVSIRALLIRETLAALRTDYAANREAAAAVEKLIDSTAQRAEYLRLLALGQENSGETMGAFYTLVKLIELMESAHESQRGVDATLEQIEPGRTSRLNRAVRASLARLRSAATPEERRQMDELIQSRFDTAIQP